MEVSSIFIIVAPNLVILIGLLNTVFSTMLLIVPLFPYFLLNLNIKKMKKKSIIKLNMKNYSKILTYFNEN